MSPLELVLSLQATFLQSAPVAVRQIAPDGACLYNCLSVCVSGKETYSGLLRSKVGYEWSAAGIMQYNARRFCRVTGGRV
jgi:hypothetical protein